MKFRVIIYALWIMTIPVSGAACGKTAEFQKALNDKYHEAPRGAGMSAGNTVMVTLYVSPSGTYTVLVTYTWGQSCIIAAGDDWTEIKPEIRGEKS